MREIKFRAWDGKMMIDPVWAWDKSSNHFEHYNELHENWMYGLGVENVTLMQYTGLRDKNGVEIYEGDVFLNEIGLPYVISWVDHLARFSCLLRNNYGNRDIELEAYVAKQFEVIGNIHENPELLRP